MLLLLVGLACLFPLSLYCLYMAMLHQRGRPTMIPGPWDAAGLLIALSGFLLVGGSVIVFGFHTAIRDYWLLGGSVHNLAELHGRVGTWTIAIWGGYVLALLVGGAWLIGSRRHSTMLYHLTPADMDQLLPPVLERLGLSHNRRGSRWLVGLADQPLTTFQKVMAAPERGPQERGVVEVDGSEAMRIVILRWKYATGPLRADLEAELSRSLAAYAAPPSPATTWFMTAAAAIFMAMIFLLATFLIVSLR